MTKSLLACSTTCLLLVGCGGSGKTDAPDRSARSPEIQRQVARDVEKKSEERLEETTGSYTDPELQKTKTDCIPESDSKLSCLVEGSAQAGFEDDADPTATGPFQFRWEVIVDSASGRWQARVADVSPPSSGIDPSGEDLDLENLDEY